MDVAGCEKAVAAGTFLPVLEVQLDAGVAERVATSGRERFPQRLLADRARELVQNDGRVGTQLV